jgi:hypothetical protein
MGGFLHRLEVEGHKFTILEGLYDEWRGGTAVFLNDSSKLSAVRNEPTLGNVQSISLL